MNPIHTKRLKKVHLEGAVWRLTRTLFVLVNTPMKVLVVEDETRIAQFIEMGLREQGWMVDVQHRGDEAMTALESRVYVSSSWTSCCPAATD